ncbi:MAG: diguanylate cyclase [Lachnospiraceae bacterium]|nr:diguanylate cyclase [Lachnospiraceae bacterium]
MMVFFADHQLNMMLALSGICATLSILIIIAKALTVRRRAVLVTVELTAFGLVTFDRLAYIFSGQAGTAGYLMVRISNFFVFFLTSGMVLAFNIYIGDLLMSEGQLESLPKRLKLTMAMAMTGMLLIVLSQFTGLIYYIDESNIYHRSPMFILCYAAPVIAPLIQLSVIIQHRKRFNRSIFISLVLFIVVPIVTGIVQIFAYGLSLVNMSMVLVALTLYIFAYFDINESVEKMHKAEMYDLDKDRKSSRRLFEQTAKALAELSEEGDRSKKGQSERIAQKAEQIARASGKNGEECESIYFTALLSDVKPDILSEITEYPDLSRNVMYSNEYYDGTGSPEGKKGNQIPDAARIVAVARRYENMAVSCPLAMIREEFVKEAGLKYDPDYSRILVELMDEEAKSKALSEADNRTVVSDLDCKEYRDSFSGGIEITSKVKRISFNCSPSRDEGKRGMSAVVLYDSLDGSVHDNIHTIKAYDYIEYGEAWFDGHMICTRARNMEIKTLQDKAYEETGTGEDHEITAERYEDHLRLVMKCSGKEHIIIVALPDATRSSYLALTGQWCHISDIREEFTGEETKEGDIRRIADAISYIDRIESDVPNIQIDRNRSASTAGIQVTDHLTLRFHSRSLPTASLVWHCPYILFFYSDDMKVEGPGYREYEMIKLNGENNGSNEFADCHFILKKTDFDGWDAWMEKNRSGFECEILISRRGNRITMTTVNMGISIQETITIKDPEDKVYVALTGDQCALTDIRTEEN